MMIEQTIIAISGVVAIFLTQSRNADHHKYACLFGIIGQPLWVLATYQSEQWGMFVLAICYTFAWISGIVNFWFKRG